MTRIVLWLPSSYVVLQGSFLNLRPFVRAPNRLSATKTHRNFRRPHIARCVVNHSMEARSNRCRNMNISLRIALPSCNHKAYPDLRSRSDQREYAPAQSQLGEY